MAVSPALPRTHLAIWVKSLSQRARRPHVSGLMPAAIAPSQRPSEQRVRSVIPAANPYALELEEGEPTWEDAEWQ